MIEVTLTDIKTCRDGKFKGGFHHCPIELAAQRAFKQPVWAIGTEQVWLVKDDTFHDLPYEAQSFAEDYDAGKKVQPMRFVLGAGSKTAERSGL